MARPAVRMDRRDAREVQRDRVRTRARDRRHRGRTDVSRGCLVPGGPQGRRPREGFGDGERRLLSLPRRRPGRGRRRGDGLDPSRRLDPRRRGPRGRRGSRDERRRHRPPSLPPLTAVDDLHRRVERGYDAIAHRYAQFIRANRGPETYFRSFLDRIVGRIRKGGRVLDLGCGAGLVSAELVARARVIALDRSAVQLSLSRANVPDAVLVRADIAEVAFRPGSFDAVVAFWTLIHVDRDRHGSVLARVHEWLRPGGLFAATLGTTNSPEDVEEDFFGAPMSWSHFDAPTSRRLVRDAGFEIEQADEVFDEGEMALWMIATA